MQRTRFPKVIAFTKVVGADIIYMKIISNELNTLKQNIKSFEVDNTFTHIYVYICFKLKQWFIIFKIQSFNRFINSVTMNATLKDEKKYRKLNKKSMTR